MRHYKDNNSKEKEWSLSMMEAGEVDQHTADVCDHMGRVIRK